MERINKDIATETRTETDEQPTKPPARIQVAKKVVKVFRARTGVQAGWPPGRCGTCGHVPPP